MGTNYYLRQDPEPDLHIGKASFGWVFLLHIYPELGINDWEDWLPLLAFGEIRDESESPISLETMVSLVTSRDAFGENDRTPTPFEGRTWVLLEGDFS